MNYSYDDLLTIAKGQVKMEEKMLSLESGSLEPGSGITTAIYRYRHVRYESVV